MLLVAVVEIEPAVHEVAAHKLSAPDTAAGDERGSDVLFVFDINLQAVGMMANKDIEALIPDGVQLVQNELGLEDSGRAELAADIGISDVLAIDVKEHCVCVWKVFSAVDMDMDASMEKDQLGFVYLILFWKGAKIKERR